MQKLIKIFLIIAIPSSIIFLILLFVNTVITDWKYAHKSLMTYQNSFNWPLYKTKINLLKFKRSIIANNEIGLKRVNLYIDENLQKKLLFDVPKSTKDWQEGFYLLDNKKLKKIMMRHRGDNPRNWLFEKKHWRIKSRKSDQFNRHRYYDFFPFNLEKYISGKIASDTGLISPKYELIELFINDKSSGIYIQAEYINENFLRRNKLMPVNIYKGEQILTESTLATTGDLFNNTSTWTKAATFNKLQKSDKSDLKFFLTLLNNSELEKKSYKKLIDKIDVDMWSKFAAYQILTQNFHNDYGHNMRLISDSWSGKILPVVHDPIIGENIKELRDISFDFSSHGLLAFLNRNSFFIHQKYQKLYDYIVNDQIIKNQLRYLKEIEDKIIVSEKRDLEIQNKFNKNINFIEMLSFNKKILRESTKERNYLSGKLLNYELIMLKMFNTEPQASWNIYGNNLNINIDGYLPLSNIEIFFEGVFPKWIGYDFNKNDKIDHDEKFFTNDEGKVVVPITIYANRFLSAKKLYNLIEPKTLRSNTKFEFILDNVATPKKIISTNPFTFKRSQLKNDQAISVPTNKFNFPILNIKYNDIFKRISGTILVDKDIIFNDNIIIDPGTKFRLNNGKSIIFKNKVQALGTKENPIIFESSISGKNKIWGTVAFQGLKTSGSILQNVYFDGGSGAVIDQIHYTSMLSLHDTKDIKLLNLHLKNNHIYDDALHLVYCDNINIENLTIESATGDALDIDISKNIIVKNSKFTNSVNDGIDLMESEVLIDSTIIVGAGDKGISAGENSNLLLYNSTLSKNKTGIAVKDKSNVKVIYSTFESNNSHIDAYQKNLQYGDGGSIEIQKSFFESYENKFTTDRKSNILIEDSSFNKFIISDDEKIVLSENNSYNGNKNTQEYLNLFIKHPLLSKISNINDKKIRGSTFLIN